MTMTIQQAAQKILLIFYSRYSRKGYITDGTFTFQRDNVWSFDTDDDDALGGALSKSINSPVLLKVAIQYLEDKGLITFLKKGVLSGELIMYNFSITSAGVDMIEGVGDAGNSREVYQKTFNVTLNSNITLESLIKTELKASLLSLL